MRLKHFLYAFILVSCILLMSAGQTEAATTNTNSGPISIQDAHAYPNPFDNETEITTITFTVNAEASMENITVAVVVYDYNGKKAWTKKLNTKVSKGNNKFNVSWGGQNDIGEDVANGLYFAKIIVDAANTKVKVVKILVK